MGFLKKASPLYKAATGGVWGKITGSTGRKQARQDIQRGYAEGQATIKSAYPKAQQQLAAGYDVAKGDVRRGYDTAQEQLTTGYGKAIGTAGEGYGAAIGRAQEGYGKAQAQYETPEMVASRQELFGRVLGKGGYDEATMEKMKARTREEYGTGLREAERGLQSYFGDSAAPGMAAENFARASVALGAARASGIRDIDINNEMLKRSEQTDAIASLQAEAQARGGLSADEARVLSGLEADRANVISGLQEKLATGQAQLSTEEAGLLADLEARAASGQAALTAEEAQLLAQLQAGMGAAMAGTRNTAGLMPLAGPTIQAGGALGAAAIAACWVAAVLYGRDSLRFNLARFWIFDVWKGPVARLVQRFYLRFGERIASMVERNRAVRWIAKKLFDRAVKLGLREVLLCRS